jgi:hypothetical protein
MTKKSYIVALAAVVALAGGSAIVAAQQQSNRASDRQADLFRRLDEGIVTFRAGFDRAMNRSRTNGTRPETDINKAVNDFKLATDRLSARSQQRRVVAADAEEVLRRASSIDRFMASNALDATVERDWLNLRRDLDELAREYNVAWNWDSPRNYADGRRGSVNRRLTGTYQLESNQGDDAERAVLQATRALPPDQRQAASRRLMNRLNAPETIAIDRRGNNITMASSRGRQVTFEADGQVRAEQGGGGRTMNTRATLNGDQLMVTTTGNRGSDYAVTFEPTDNGRNMRVTRRIQDDTLRQPVTVHSFYRKSSDEALWNIDLTDGRTPPRTDPRAGDLDMPDGTRLVATLDSALSTRSANAEDRFSMTTISPPQYEGAIIEGTVSSVNASGRVSGRADMALNFDSIRLRNGRTHEFAGVIENVRTADGKTINVDNEGKVGDGSQTEKTVQVGAVGAALGAIIGAISGGGKGAAIGAAIGAAGGAGTVVAQGRDQLDLPRGTELTITSSLADGPRTAGRER